ncbi:MAG TPA: class E sortase [Acidimicrobiales bacterium]
MDELHLPAEDDAALIVEADPASIGRRRLFGLAAGGAAAVAGGVLLGAGPAEAASRRPAPKPQALGGSIVIPKLRVNKPLYEGIATLSLNAGPGHWPGTPFPGQPGNAVFAGHRVSRHRVFRNIHKLVPGDLVRFQMWYGTFDYLVTGSEVVHPRTGAGSVLSQTATATATLFSCHPPGSTRLRYVVHLSKS